MKKYIAILCVLTLLFSLTGCAFSLRGDDDDDSSSSTSSSESSGSVEENDSSVVPVQTSVEAKLMYVTGTSEQIAMRETDEDSAAAVDYLSLGDEVKLVSADSVMYYCVLNDRTGKQGYVKKAYLTDEKSAVCKNEELFTSKQTSLFDTKAEDRKELQKLNAGSSVTVLAKTSGDFWFVNVTGSKTYGYVKCMELSQTKPTASSAAASSKAASSKAASTAPAQQAQPKNNDYYIGSGSGPANYSLYYAKVNTGYLAIRRAKAFDASNEIGKMYTGYSVYVIDKSTGTYWYCYSPDCGVYGYVNSDYLVTSYPGSTTNYTPSSDYTVWTVKVNTGYLALRSAAANNDANIIGQMYTGDKVYVYSYSYANFSDVYWYVYSPALGMWGYVNSNYIYS